MWTCRRVCGTGVKQFFPAEGCSQFLAQSCAQSISPEFPTSGHCYALSPQLCTYSEQCLRRGDAHDSRVIVYPLFLPSNNVNVAVGHQGMSAACP